ncbi:nuclear fragile X mental retardation-interacting protein 2 [Silurus asotus]|uniref:Nuclear fragile X mental retardation-interacting protein 2 n=1 Tax=Silurus asotus TaxID=30991 RepID=A0AAD5AXA7_SILAS|nr:nuclear fragile X mental retardation-interacting protein 2 [Silurus asotus]
MDGNHQSTVLKHYEVKSMHEKEPVLSLNGEVGLSSGYITNGYLNKSVDNDGSGSESGYTTPRKRRARRSSMKGTESVIREKVSRPFSKQELDNSSQEAVGKSMHSRPNCTRAYLKSEVHTGVRRTGVQETSPVPEVQQRNSDSKTSVSLVSKRTDEKVSKTKLVSSVNSKEDSWTLFKPPPVFPVDNSSAKIVPKISYASKVKENLNKASAETTQTHGKLSHVPMSAVKTITSASFANISASLDANGSYSVETSFDSPYGDEVAPSASANQAGEDVENAPGDGCSSSFCPSASEPRKSSLFVYPHKPLNMQPLAAQTNQKALTDIFQNQWGLSFINEPNAGPEGVPVSHLTVPFEISEITFHGGNFPFLIQPSLNAVSLPAPQDAQRRTNRPAVAGKPCSIFRPGHQEECKAERRISDASCEDLDAEPPRNSVLNSVQVHTVKEQNRAHEWGWTDLRAAVLYHSKEFEYLLTLHKQGKVKNDVKTGIKPERSNKWATEAVKNLYIRNIRISEHPLLTTSAV